MAVVSRFLAVTALCLSSLVSIAAAHPGEHHDNLEVIREIKARSIEFENQSRELQSACENNEEAQARKERAYARRAATVERLRRERGLEDGEPSQRGCLLLVDTKSRYRANLAPANSCSIQELAIKGA